MHLSIGFQNLIKWFCQGMMMAICQASNMGYQKEVRHVFDVNIDFFLKKSCLEHVTLKKSKVSILKKEKIDFSLCFEE